MGLVGLLWGAAAAAQPALAETPAAAVVAQGGEPADRAGPGGPADAAPASAHSEAEPRAPKPPDVATAWLAPADELQQRVWRTRRSAVARGVWNVDGASRALLAEPGVSYERAQAAMQLAPDLPAARAAWARALWLKGESPLAALRAAGAAIRAFGFHPEGALWLGGSLLTVLAVGLLAGGMLCLAVFAALAAPRAAHDLGDVFSRSMPSYGRAALLAAVMLAPAAVGEGVLGTFVAATLVAAVYGARTHRFSVVLAAACVVAGAYPIARGAGMVLGALPGDPVARSALAASRGIALPADVARLEAAGKDDLLAQQGLARLARRAGNFGTADAIYQKLVAQQPEDPVVLTNAANVRLHLGHMEAAFKLYQRALEVEPSAAVLYNVAQAHGRAYQVDDLARALERAQAVDAEVVADLTRLQGTEPEGLVVDLPLANPTLWKRVLSRADGQGFAAQLRAPVAPGRLGSSLEAASGAFGGAWLVGSLLGWRIRPSRRCSRCGTRVCPRCDGSSPRVGVCVPCNQLFNHPENTDRSLRAARLDALRTRETRMRKLAWLASVVIPGVAGALAGRPLRSLIGSVAFVVAVAAFLARDGVVPDPLVAGEAGLLASVCVVGFGLACYAVTLATSLASHRSS